LIIVAYERLKFDFVFNARRQLVSDID
jgi:hypothetical protein